MPNNKVSIESDSIIATATPWLPNSPFRLHHATKCCGRVDTTVKEVFKFSIIGSKASNSITCKHCYDIWETSKSIKSDLSNMNDQIEQGTSLACTGREVKGRRSFQTIEKGTIMKLPYLSLQTLIISQLDNFNEDVRLSGLADNLMEQAAAQQQEDDEDDDDEEYMDEQQMEDEVIVSVASSGGEENGYQSNVSQQSLSNSSFPR